MAVTSISGHRDLTSLQSEDLKGCAGMVHRNFKLSPAQVHSEVLGGIGDVLSLRHFPGYQLTARPPSLSGDLQTREQEDR